MSAEEMAIDAGILINKGVMAGKQGRLDEAVQIFTQVLDQRKLSNEQKAKAIFNRAVIYAAQGNREKALDDFSGALYISGPEWDKRATTLFARATTYGKLERYELAIQDLLACIDCLPDDAEERSKSVHNLAAFRQRRNQSHKEIARLTAIIKTPVVNIVQRHKALFDRAILFASGGDWQDALSDYDHLIPRVQDLELKLMALTNRGATYVARGLFSNAYLDYTAVIHQSTDFPAIKANGYNNLGMLLMQMGQVSNALEQFNLGIAIRNVTTDVSWRLHLNRATLLGDLADWAAQIDDLTLVLSSPDLPEAFKPRILNTRGTAFLQVGADARAQTDFEYALSISSIVSEQVAVACGALGFLSVRAGKTQEALRYFDKALEQEMISSNVLSNVLFNRAALLSDLGQSDTALVDYQRLVQINNVDHHTKLTALYNSALILLQMSKDTAAFNLLSEVVADPQVEPNLKRNALIIRGQTYYDLAKYEFAHQDFQIAWQLANDVKLGFQLLLADLAMGQTEAAKVQLKWQLEQNIEPADKEFFLRNLAFARQNNIDAGMANEIEIQILRSTPFIDSYQAIE